MKMHPCAALAALLLAGCAGVSPQQRNYLDVEAARIARSGVAVVADGCVMRDEIGDDYIVGGLSAELGQRAGMHVARYLGERGVQVRAVVVPFSCGFQPDSSQRVAAAIGASRSDQPVPIALTPDTQPGAPLRAAHHALARAVTEGAARFRDADSQGAQLLLIDADSARVLGEALGTNDVWYVRASGGQVSTGKAIGVGLLTGAATLALTGGAAYGISMLFDGNSYDLALVRLDTQEIAWSRNRRVTGGDASDPGVFDEDWVAAAFEPFFVDGAPAAVAALPAPRPSPPRIASASGSVVLRERPAAAAPAFAVAAAGAQRVRQVANAEGEWWYLRMPAGEGWIPAAEAP